MTEPNTPSKTDADAAAKYAEYCKVDPFPSIPPSLLNSADIEDYVNATGMIYPFDREEDLKSSSYTARISGEIVWWDEKRRKSRVVLDGKEDEPFRLLPNSIAFVQVEPYFRLPDYIAVRFNLTITNVYRGLLLGTGPLVDPGFRGHIYIPLHNLTTNTYELNHRDKLIWIEFTKTSPVPTDDPKQVEDSKERQGKFQPFPEDKKDKNVDYYLKKAVEDMEIVSSIPDAMKKARDEAKKAKRSAETAEKSASRQSRHSLFGASAFIISLAVMLLSVWTAFQNYNDKVDVMRTDLQDLRHDLQEQQKLGEKQQEQIDLQRELIEREESPTDAPGDDRLEDDPPEEASVGETP